MRFIPSKNYDGLLIQACALNNLVKCNEAMMKIYRDTDYKLSQTRLDSLESALESEREANSILTEENENMLRYLKEN